MIRPIRSEKDYETALARIKSLMDAEANTPEADELEVLGALCALHESEMYGYQSKPRREAARQSAVLDKPEDRLWHAEDGSWWKRVPSSGRLVAADPPGYITDMEAESKGQIYALEQQGKQLKKAQDELAEERARLNWLESEANRRGGLLLHDGSERGRRGLGLRPGYIERTLREAIDAAGEKKEGKETND